MPKEVTRGPLEQPIAQERLTTIEEALVASNEVRSYLGLEGLQHHVALLGMSANKEVVLVRKEVCERRWWCLFIVPLVFCIKSGKEHANT